MRIPTVCKGCRNLHGKTYRNEKYEDHPTLVCGMHPYGAENDTCPDLEKFDYALTPGEYLDLYLADIKTNLNAEKPEMPEWVLELTAIAQARNTHLTAVELAIVEHKQVPDTVLHHFAKHSDLAWNHLWTGYEFEALLGDAVQ